MKNRLGKLVLMMGMVALVGCSTTNEQWSGGLFGSYISFSVTKLAVNKYLLEAKVAWALVREKRDQMISAYQARAAKLCAPKSYHTKYQIIPYRFEETLSGGMVIPYSGMKMTGVVWCS